MKRRRFRFILAIGMIAVIVFAVPLVAEASDVKFNAKNFPDANFRKAVKRAYPELLNDGVLSDKDKAQIKHLNIADSNVKSLEGIGYFTKLVGLNCNNNPITVLPKLPNTVTSLACSNCKLTKIEQLPKNLDYLYCMNNKITSLPKLPESLVQINVSNNKLKKLEGDFSNTYNLFASDNLLEGTFDVSKGKKILCCVLANNHLTRVVLREGHGYSNLDLQNNFLLNKSYVLNMNEKTVRFQFAPQKSNHEFNGYMRVSKATLTASGLKTAKCKDCTVTKKLEIPKIQSVKLAYNKTTYDGKKKTPAVTVKHIYGKELKQGTDYTVNFGKAKRSAVGRYAVTVTFKGNYKGTKKLWFTIVPKAPATLKGTLSTYDGKDAVKLTWAKVSNADGYYVHVKQGTGVYKLSKTIKSEKTVTTTIKNLKDGKKYTFKVTPYYQGGNGTKYKSIKHKTVVKNT